MASGGYYHKILAIAALVLLTCAGVLGWQSPARAEVSVRPLIEAQVDYSSNFYRTDGQEQGVWVTRVSPGLVFDAYTDRSRFSVDYRLNAFWHTGGDEEVKDVTEDDYIGHDLSLYTYTTLGDRFFIGLEDEFFLTREPAFADTFFLPSFRNKYWRNRATPFISYDLAEKGTIRLGYRNEIIEFTEKQTQAGFAEPEDSMEHRGLLMITYNIDESNFLDLDAQYWTRDYDGDNPDYDSLQVALIYRHHFAEFLRGSVGAGYHWRNFKDDALSALDDFVVSASLTGESDITRLSVTLLRNINDYTIADDYYLSYRLVVDGERRIGENFKVSLGGFYQNSDYQYYDRLDIWWSLYGGIAYSFLNDTIELSLRYDYTDRDSNWEGYDYKEHQVFFTVRASYDVAK